MSLIFLPRAFVFVIWWIAKRFGNYIFIEGIFHLNLYFIYNFICNFRISFNNAYFRVFQFYAYVHVRGMKA